MSVAVRSFAKINIGLRIGASRPDGFHELRTVYQTIDLADIVRVDVGRGTGIVDTTDEEWNEAFDQTLMPAIRASRRSCRPPLTAVFF